MSDGVIKENETVVAILTGHLLKDTEYVMKYHSRSLAAPDGLLLEGRFCNVPIQVAASRDALRKILTTDDTE